MNRARTARCGCFNMWLFQYVADQWPESYVLKEQGQDLDGLQYADALFIAEDTVKGIGAQDAGMSLAYLQTKVGYEVNKDVPRLSGGPSSEPLYKMGQDWLDGK